MKWLEQPDIIIVCVALQIAKGFEFMIKFRPSIIAIVLIFLCGCSTSANKAEFEIEKTFFAMDTSVSYFGNAEAYDSVNQLITDLDGLFDRYSDSSDIYAINNRKKTTLSDYTNEIITLSNNLSKKYGSDVNIFSGEITDCWKINSENPTVPSDDEINKALKNTENTVFSMERMSFESDCGSIDLGSVGKGYALDKAYELLGDENCYIISMNSSILLSGKKSDGSKFTVSVRNPENGSEIIGTIKTDACFLSTSGGYERFFEADGKKYSHIFDVSTARPVNTDLTSVTVMCDSGIESDFLSTLIYIGGSNKLGKYLKNDKIKLLAVTENNEIYMSDGLDFSLAENSDYSIKVSENA